jgi:hypothetical protein
MGFAREKARKGAKNVGTFSAQIAFDLLFPLVHRQKRFAGGVDYAPGQSGRGLPHSKTWRKFSATL